MWPTHTIHNELRDMNMMMWHFMKTLYAVNLCDLKLDDGTLYDIIVHILELACSDAGY